MDRPSWHFANMSSTLASRAHRDLATADPEKHPERSPSPSASIPLLFSVHHAHTYTRAYTSPQGPPKVANNRRSRRWATVFPRNPWDRIILLVFFCSLLIFGHALFGLGLADAGLAKVRGEFHELHWHPFAHAHPWRRLPEEGESGGMGLKLPAHAQAPPLRPQAQEELFPPQLHPDRPIVGGGPEL
ncbi:hypothetical protein SCLCIDRAFT_204692 [Scleroderma citrinum Foug A]|uniref:Uncharacterized protein n=1 Tax=Scleroderma citrinum Foug A TaxID=1036808 RepID=A0A0C3D7N8_9AGAM|nr:hypothetical protein SCLCIDRAFT_204692 [Scleroderma citrinum Foug A]